MGAQRLLGNMIVTLDLAIIIMVKVGAVQTNQRCCYVIRNEVGKRIRTKRKIVIVSQITFSIFFREKSN